MVVKRRGSGDKGGGEFQQFGGDETIGSGGTWASMGDEEGGYATEVALETNVSTMGTTDDTYLLGD